MARTLNRLSRSHVSAMPVAAKICLQFKVKTISKPSVTIRVGQREPVFHLLFEETIKGGTVGKSVNIHRNQLGCVRTRAVGHSRSSADIARATVELTGSRGISSRLAAESWHMERQTPGRPSELERNTHLSHLGPARTILRAVKKQLSIRSTTQTGAALRAESRAKVLIWDRNSSLQLESGQIQVQLHKLQRTRPAHQPERARTEC
ncbi:hypothetical protein B0H14DRAFT_3595580 [Mycena olivaceomarginata]|nr:hypothetical protein B0H14DRAFT_3595580 [Mycena olivaceomarginata]